MNKNKVFYAPVYLFKHIHSLHPGVVVRVCFASTTTVCMMSPRCVINIAIIHNNINKITIRLHEFGEKIIMKTVDLLFLFICKHNY